MMNTQPPQSHTFSQEVYGFARFAAGIVLLALTLLLAIVPNDLLVRYGVTVYPNMYWFLAVPSIIIFSTILLLFNYILFNFRHTHTPTPRDDCFVRDNLSRRIRNEDCNDVRQLFQVSNDLDNGTIDGENSQKDTKINDNDEMFKHPIDSRPVLESYDIPPTLVTEYLLKDNKRNATTLQNGHKNKL